MSDDEYAPVDEVDLFSGAEGLGVAARNLGQPDALGVEFARWPVETARAAGFPVLQVDVRKVQPVLTLRKGGRLKGSPPCQPFAQSGSGKGLQHLRALAEALRLVAYEGADPAYAVTLTRDPVLDERTVLVLEPMRWVRDCMPVSIGLEQVPTALPVWEAYAVILREMGYSVWTGKVHSEQYGLGQARTRGVLLASLEREVGRPAPTHSRYHRQSPWRLDDGVLPWVSMADALGPDYVPDIAVPGDASWVHRRPSPTQVGSFAADIMAAPGYRKAGDPPRQRTPGSVRITVAQAAILQGFPADHPWRGPDSAVWLQLGNAIPVALAQACTGVLLGLHEPVLAQTVCTQPWSRVT